MASTRITSFQVAKAAGVSRTTVSLVLNNVKGATISAETRQRVLDAARALNYVPDANARRLVTGTSKTLALSLHRVPDEAFANAYLSQTLAGVTQLARQNGFRLTLELTECEKELDGLHRLLRSGAVDGLICEAWMREDDLRRAGFRPEDPLILLCEEPLRDFSYVSASLIRAQRQLIDQALSLGHRDFACITYTDLGESASLDRRYADLEAQLADAGARILPGMTRSGGMTIDGAAQAMVQMLRLPERPTVLFGMNDQMAIGALRAAQAQGMGVPKDLSILGFEGQDLAQLVTPQIDTVKIPWREKAALAVKTLITRLAENNPQPCQKTLDADLAPGGSLAPPRR